MRWLRWGICGALLSQMALCPRLWTSGRSFPTLPALEGLPDLPPVVTLALVGLLVASVLTVGSEPSGGGQGGGDSRATSIQKVRIPNAKRPEASTPSVRHTVLRHAPCAVVILGGLLASFDINRLQPWFYQSMLMFLALGVARRKDAWAACGFILSATYVWSGLQKVNASFAGDTFPWLLKPLGLESLQPFWWVAPLLETSVGILLFIPRTRRVGLVGAGVMHAFLLLALGPFGQNFNSVVWPWNVWMPLLAFVVFFRNPEPLLPSAWVPARGKAIVVLAGLLPVLSFFGRWDIYLSAALYSGRADQGYLLFTEEGARRLPARVQPFVTRSSDRIGLDLFRWSMADMNVPCYPEVRVYRAIGRKLEQTGVPSDGMILVVTDRPSLTSDKPRTRVVPVR